MLIENFLEVEITSKGIAKNTYIAYRKDLLFLDSFLRKNLNKNISDATKSDIDDFFMFLSRDKGLSAKSISRYITSINSFYNFCVTSGFIKENPCKNIVYPKLNITLPKYLTPNEINILLNYAKEKGQSDFKYFRMYTMLQILYSSGLRVSELLNLNKTIISKLDNDDKINLVSVIGKGNIERKIPINYSAKLAIFEYIKRFNDIIRQNEKEQSKKLFPITRMSFFNSLKKLALVSGIMPSKVFPHVFRHSVASHLLSSGTDLRIIQQILGHANISTTGIYTHIQNEKLKQSVKQSHPFAKVDKI